MAEQLNHEGRKGVDAYTAPELHCMLVADAVKGHATHLPWAVAAYSRIGERTKRGADAAYTEVLDEVEVLTGRRSMPVKATTLTELAALKKPT